jgi:hypothetical protein
MRQQCQAPLIPKIVKNDAGTTGTKRAPLVLLLCVTAYFGISFYDASLISDRLITDKIFPLLISGIELYAAPCC